MDRDSQSGPRHARLITSGREGPREDRQAMATGRDTAYEAAHRGIYVIPAAMTAVDGVPGASYHDLFVGSTWRWQGEAARIDGPQDLLPLGAAEGAEEMRRRAGRAVRRLLGERGPGPQGAAAAAPLPDSNGFAVTDGTSRFRLDFAGEGRLLTVRGPLPPCGIDLAVIEKGAGLPGPSARPGAAGGAVCFTPGTLLDTPEGPRAVETLRPGDRVATRDSGAQEVIWVGGRQFSGAHLFAMPQLRPVRIRQGALGQGLPMADLILSPEHRLVIAGAAARLLFGEAEVLVAARDLPAAATLSASAAATYIHVMTRRHEVLVANGVACESFHPASADFRLLDPAAQGRLSRACPAAESDPLAYGDFARRCLSRAEAALLQHAIAVTPPAGMAAGALTLAAAPV